MLQLACKGQIACNNKHAKDNNQVRCSQHIGQDGNMVQQWHIMQYNDGYSHD